MPTLREIGERGLVRIARQSIDSHVDIGPGDDAAAIDMGDFYLVACTDLVSFQKHRPQGMSLSDLGWMAVAVNLSDIASMGAEPVGFMCTLALPEDMEVEGFQELMDGMRECTEAYGTEIIGGDTKSGQGIVCGTALGKVRKDGILRRSGAKPGDLVAVTGHLGEAAAGYHSILSGMDIPEARMRLFRPRPRVTEGRTLSECPHVTSCMDISDGLSTTLAQMMEAGDVGFRILWESIPEGPHVREVSEKASVSLDDMILNFGGDYELLFTLDPKGLEELYETEIDFSIIGKVSADRENVLIKDNSIINMLDEGYEHFRR